ncbi:MAG: hypothetical protein HQ582_12850 [Planctomycetes bacterium]|nr:hypothetical protein [Planctomycetota bacterium]
MSIRFRSLKTTDAAGLQFAFNPHFFYPPSHTDGATRCEFDLRVEPGVLMYHEWRDNSQPYRVGPSVWVRDRTVSAMGKNLLEIPPGEWVYFEIVAKLGRESSGTWSLSITVPGQNPAVFDDLPIGHPEWRKLDWLGFSSNATDQRVYYLDNIHLANTGEEYPAHQVASPGGCW